MLRYLAGIIIVEIPPLFCFLHYLKIICLNFYLLVVYCVAQACLKNALFCFFIVIGMLRYLAGIVIVELPPLFSFLCGRCSLLKFLFLVRVIVLA